MFLNVSYDGIEFEVFFGLWGLDHFETDWALASIVETNFLSVDVTEKADLEIVELFFNSDGNLDAFACDCEGDRR